MTAYANLRARLAKFDRPAIDLDEMMRATGGDFVHIAYWSLLGRSPTADEYQQWMDGWAEDTCRHFLLEYLLATSKAQGEAANEYPGLERQVAICHRAKLPLAHRVLAVATDVLVLPAIGVSKNIRGKIRWAYRHTRKALIRTASRLRLPSQSKVREVLKLEHSAPPVGTPPDVADLYKRLCAARAASRNDA